MPVQSTIERVGDDAVERVVVRRRRPPGPCRRAAPCRRRTCTRRRRRVRSRSTSATRRCRRAGRGRRWSVRRCRRSGAGRVGGSWLLPVVEPPSVAAFENRARPSSVTSPSPSSLPPRTTCAPAMATSVHRLASRPARSGPRCRPGCRGACRRRGPRSNERAVGLGEVIVAADLDRPVAAVGHGELDRRRRPALSSISPAAASTSPGPRRSAVAPAADRPCGGTGRKLP